MDNTKRRIKRMGPLIRVRQLQLDYEASQLARIKQIKTEAERQLQEFQTKYMAGVNMLNEVRNSADRQYLSILESGLDMLKTKWYKTLKNLREIEQVEYAQLEQVKLARKNMKTMETLKGRYVEQAAIEDLKRDQKIMDDNAVRRFVDQMNDKSTKPGSEGES